MMDMADRIGPRLLRALRETVTAEGRRAWKEAFATAWPVAARHIRRERLKTAVFSLCVATSVCIYLLFSAFAAATSRSALSGVDALALPADLIVVSGPLSDEQVREVDRAPDIDLLEKGYWLDALSQGGRMPLVGLDPKAKALERMGTVVWGRMPARPGEMAVPEALGFTGPAEGFMVTRTGPGGELLQRAFSVVGAYRPLSVVATCLVAVDADARALDAGRQPNALFGFVDEGTAMRELEIRTQRVLPEARVYSPVSPSAKMTSLVSSVLSPSNLATSFVFGLGGLGMFNLQLLSFLRRKREIGILRALGMDAREAGVLLFLEGFVLAIVGTVLGSIAAHLVIRQVGPALPYALTISPWAPAKAAFYSLLVFVAATWIPVALSARATVDQLLYNRRVYLNPNLSCANCGRCGGF
ncbi:MAG: ABC transporter permease [Bacillota bacterium]|nr:ABC transporter permease [Bacillota bacterium]